MPRSENVTLRERLYPLFAETPEAGRVVIARLYAERYGKTEAVHDVTVGRYRKKWEALKPSERAHYRSVSWPETFERGDLPWEASAVVFELLHASRRAGLPLVRPLVRTARWFWRVTQAAPGAPLAHRAFVAGMLSAEEASLGAVRGGQARWAEGDIAYRTWTPEGSWEHQKAVEAGLMTGPFAVAPPSDVRRDVPRSHSLAGILAGLAQRSTGGRRAA